MKYSGHFHSLGKFAIPVLALALTQFGTAVEITLNNTWDLYDPEGNSSLSSQSGAGFTATIADVTPIEDEPIPRPSVTNTFLPVSLAEMGDVVTATFDLDILDTVEIANDSDFRFSFFDTSTNFEIVTGMIDLGTASGTSMRIRVDDHVSAEPGAFVPGDFSHLGGASLTIGGTGTKPGGTGEIVSPGVVHRFVTTIERTGTNTLQIETAWGVNGSFLVAEASGDESALFVGEPPLFEHPTGHFTSFDGFGFRLEANDPFSASTTSGRYRISNLKIESYKRRDLEIVNVTKNPDNTVTLNWNSQPDAYAGYDVVYNSDLASSILTWTADSSGLAPTGTLTSHTTVETFTDPKAFFSVIEK